MIKTIEKKKLSVFRVITLIVIAVVLVFLLFPRAQHSCDGASSKYNGFFEIYVIDCRHGMNDEAGELYYEKGCIIYILGHEVFNNVYMKSKKELDDEFHKKDAELESLLFPTG